MMYSYRIFLLYVLDLYPSYLFLYSCIHISIHSWVQARGDACTGCKSKQGCVNGFIGRIDPSKVTVRLLTTTITVTTVTIIVTTTTLFLLTIIAMFPELIPGIRMIEAYNTTVGTLEFGYGGGGCMTYMPRMMYGLVEWGRGKNLSSNRLCLRHTCVRIQFLMQACLTLARMHPHHSTWRERRHRA